LEPGACGACVARLAVRVDEWLTDRRADPRATLQAYFCDGMNFKEFVRLLAPYSPKAAPSDKVRALFAVWDVNGDGRVCKEDVALVLREAGGTNLMEGEVAMVLERLFERCEGKLGRRIGAEGMTVGEFESVLGADVSLDLGVDFTSL